MNCSCGIPAFFYETIKSDNNKYSVYKCGAVYSESKRGKCGLNVETLLNKITMPMPLQLAQSVIKQDETVREEKDTKIEIYKNLDNYIYLLEISKNNYGMSEDNYISNINFILKKLNLPLFFQKNENLMSLKLRIYDIPLKKPPIKRLFPVSILEIPENLRVQNKKSICKTKTVFNRGCKKFDIPRLVLNPEDIISSIKKLEIKSDSEQDSESENEEDNTFDVDNSDSEMEDNFCDDGGGLSD
jgi:hypothetical protein